MKRLFHDCGFKDASPPFEGALELGRLAKEAGIAARANVGLADLCALVLKRHLSKDADIRVSTSWDSDPLPDAHIHYAALDSYATWAVFCGLSTTLGGVGNVVDASTPGGTAVSLFSSDNSQVVAHGIILPERPTKLDGVNVTKTRIPVVINEVLVPGHLVSSDLLSISESKPLSMFPPPPFELLSKAKHLRMRRSDIPSPTPNDTATSTSATEKAVLPTQNAEALDDSDAIAIPDPVENISPWFADTENDLPLPNEQLPAVSFRDPASHAKACQLMATAMKDSQNVLRSRVLGDIWHLMHQFPIAQAHGLRRPFARALRTAFFQYDPEDQKNLEIFFESKGVSWEYVLRSHSSWLLRRVRRFVPPPEILLPRVATVIYDFGPLLCAKSNQPLFNDKAWDISINVLENIRRGFYSDPPGHQLYFATGPDKYGLPTYKCRRGTNAIEGGVHQNVIRWFGAFNAAPDFAIQLLRDYVLYHNLKVRTEASSCKTVSNQRF